MSPSKCLEITQQSDSRARQRENRTIREPVRAGMTPKKRVGGCNENLRNEFEIDRARRRHVAGASARMDVRSSANAANSDCPLGEPKTCEHVRAARREPVD